MSRLGWLTLVVALLVFTRFGSFGSSKNEFQCIQSFEDFAYSGPEAWSQRQPETLSGWQIETAVPSGPDTIEVGYPIFSVELSRVSHEGQEIWVQGWRQEEGPVWLIYKLDTQEWETVSRRIGRGGLYSGRLFLTDDGTVWSRTLWNNSEPIELETVPMLNKFNEDTRRFETFEIPVEAAVVQEPQYYYAHAVSPWPEIVLDKQNFFWIIMNWDGIYRYNPVLHTVEQFADLPEIAILEAALAIDGSLYLLKPTDRTGGSTRALFTLSEGMILHFRPESGNLEVVAVPDDGWPAFNGLLADRSGRLWLGSVGYRDQDGNWHLMHSNREGFFENPLDYRWASPTLIMESSDGRLWYNRYSDGGGEGTAWYDPELGEGCLFYGAVSNVIEDANQQLWMIAYSSLYRYDLDP